jgi:hypothetical protein
VTLASLGDVTALAAGFWSDAYQRFLGPAFWLLVPAGLLALALERRSAIALQTITAIVVGSTLYAFAMIVFFGGTGRHITPMLPLLLGTILVVFARHLPAVSGWLVVAGLTGLVLLQSGADWPAAGRLRLLTRFAEGHAIELYQEDVTVVTGDYWRVWPYGFALNLLHERVSGNRPVLPVALRSEDYYLRRAQHITPGTKIAFVPSADYHYWAVRGPRVELSVVRVTDDYELAIVKSVGE